MKNKLILFLLMAVAMPNFTTAQDSLAYDLQYQVNRVYPFIVINSKSLKEAQTLTELNPRYKAAWVKDYVSVEIATICKGKKKIARSKTNLLSQKQKEIMNQADIGTTISVNVQYLPQNNLKHNEKKEMSFDFTVGPDQDAQYASGEADLQEYLSAKMRDQISTTTIQRYNLAAVKFTINEKGAAIQAEVVESSKNEKIDQLLLETIANMPRWKPAAYANGQKVNQEFVLTVGDMESCVVNLLNIRKH